jgi:hypothetical protein
LQQLEPDDVSHRCHSGDPPRRRVVTLAQTLDEVAITEA